MHVNATLLPSVGCLGLNSVTAVSQIFSSSQHTLSLCLCLYTMTWTEHPPQATQSVLSV
jgi:hypothetical protein